MLSLQAGEGDEGADNDGTGAAGCLSRADGSQLNKPSGPAHNLSPAVLSKAGVSVLLCTVPRFASFSFVC